MIFYWLLKYIGKNIGKYLFKVFFKYYCKENNNKKKRCYNI